MILRSFPMFTSKVFPPCFADEQIESAQMAESASSSLDMVRFGLLRKYFSRSNNRPGIGRIIPLHQAFLFSRLIIVSPSLIVFSARFGVWLYRRWTFIRLIKMRTEACLLVTTSLAPQSNSLTSVFIFNLFIIAMIIAYGLPECINEQKSKIFSPAVSWLTGTIW